MGHCLAREAAGYKHSDARSANATALALEKKRKEVVPVQSQLQVTQAPTMTMSAPEFPLAGAPLWIYLPEDTVVLSYNVQKYTLRIPMSVAFVIASESTVEQFVPASDYFAYADPVVCLLCLVCESFEAVVFGVSLPTQ